MIRSIHSPWFFLFSLGLLLGGTNTSLAAIDFDLDAEPLPVEQAFVLDASALDAQTVRLQWTIAEGYYLYRQKFEFTTQTTGVQLGTAVFPKGKIKEDEFFGTVETYRGIISIDVPVERNGQDPLSLQMTAISQGCADLGVCYQPQSNSVNIRLAASESAGQTGLLKLGALGNRLGLMDDQPSYLPVEQAFVFSSEVIDATTIKARWDITEGYYLYKTKFKFNFAQKGVKITKVNLPAGEMKRDAAFGDMEVYHQAVEAFLTLAQVGTPAVHELTLNVGFQGCADAGFCYPPAQASNDLNLMLAGVAGTISGGGAIADDAGWLSYFTSMEKLTDLMQNENVLFTVLIFYLAGVGLAFTPCVFPMIPILSSIIAGEGSTISTGRAFKLSMVYVLAMAITYTTIGVIAGLATSGLDAMFQNPWVLSGFALIFVLLALSMFGYYSLQLPASLQSKLANISNRQHGGKLAGVGIMGFLSALIVGPCVAAPLAAAVLYISEQGDPYLGGIILFAMSMGMGSPLIAIGTSAGKYLPKAGGWMDTVKGIFGVALLGMAVYFLDRFLQPPSSSYLWILWIAFTIIYLTEKITLHNNAPLSLRLGKYTGITATALLSFYFFIGTEGYQSVKAGPNAAEYRTTERISGMQVIKVKGLKYVNQAIAEANRQGKGVLLDVFADWCTYCKQMDNTTFADARVQEQLRKLVMIKIDITDNDQINRELRMKYKLRTPPPVYIFLDKYGQESARIYGFKSPDQFLRSINKAFAI